MQWLESGAPTAAPSERRAKAPHPGPAIAQAYLEPLGLEPRIFADLIGMDCERLEAMLAGTMPVDVDAAVRFGRSLGVPPERIVRAPLRHDFAVARAHEHEMPQPPSDTLAALPFPAEAMSGYLARVNAGEATDNLYFVRGETDASHEADLNRVHRVMPGDRLRIYDPQDACVWAGPLLRNLDGAPLFAFARPSQWNEWFSRGYRADFFPLSVCAASPDLRAFSASRL